MIVTQDQVEQNLATLRQCCCDLQQHALSAPDLVAADKFHLLSAFNQIAMVVVALDLVSPAPQGVTGRRVA